MRSGTLLVVALTYILAITLGVAPVPAQDFETGFQAYGGYQVNDFDAVNVQTRALTMRIPIVSYPQRGHLPPFAAFVRYQSFSWFLKGRVTSGGTYYTWVPSTFGALLGSYAIPRGKEYSDHTVTPPEYAYHIIDADGAHHILGSVSGTTYKETVDGSGFRSLTGAIVDRNGIEFCEGSCVMQDNEGNAVTYSTTTGMYIDSVGRNIPNIYQTANPTAPGCYTYNMPDVNGGTAPYVFCYANFTATSNFPTSTYVSNSSATIAMLQSITLPNNTQWTFNYNSWGDLSTIGLPTGGTISYAWSNFNSGSGIVPRFVTNRSVDDGTGPKTFTYAFFNNIATVSDPLGNDTVYTFTAAIPNRGPNILTQVQYFNGSQTSGTLLKTVNTQYAISGLNPYGGLDGNLGAYSVVPIVAKTTWPNGITTQTCSLYDGMTGGPCGGTFNPSGSTFYDANGSTSTTYPFVYGSIVQKYEYDYGSGAPGPLLRQTNTQFQWQTYGNYLTANLLNLPLSATVLDGGAHQLATTTFGYDENNGSPQGIFGNQTSVIRWFNGGSSMTKRIYNAQGMPISIVDPNGNVTQIIYDGTGMFPSQISGRLVDKFTYDANIGEMTSYTDPNLQQTTFGYDSMRRLISVTYPAGGGSETYQYNDSSLPRSFTYTKTISATTNPPTNFVQVGTVDGLGRPIQTALTSDPDGTTYTATTYDPLNRASKVYNPTRCSTPTTNCGESTWGVTNTFYDALGRTCLVVPPDGTLPTGNPCASQPSNTVFTSYAGNTTTVADQAGKKRQTTTDALGRLTQVIEDPGGLGYVTTYSYDALDNLTGVLQNGSRQRTFTYDSLSRLVCASNPESSTAPCPATAINTYTPGTTGYTYDLNGNLLTKTSPAPNQSGSATVTVSFCYDALNRLTSKAYTAQACPMSSPVATYSYDQSSFNGLTIANGIGRRTGMTDSAGSEAWSYDSMGRVLADQRTTAGAIFSFPYTYNLDGSLATVTYPGLFPGDPNTEHLMPITYQQGGAGRPVSGTSYKGYLNASNVHYTPNGSICYLNEAWGNTFTHIWTFNNRLQPVRTQLYGTGHGASSPLCSASTDTTAELDLTYSFVDANGHNNGNVASITNNWYVEWATSQSFTYDSLNRIATASTVGTPSNGGLNDCWGEQYSYDPWGNLVSLAPIQPTYNGCSQESGFNFAGAIGTNNRITTAGFIYDSAGNLIAAPPTGTTYTYDAENHLIATGGQTYLYDGDGKRVEKASGSPLVANKLYWFGTGTNLLVETDGAGNRQYQHFYFYGIRLSRLSNAWNYHLGLDALGNTRFVYGSGNADGGWSNYYPFGGERPFSYGSTDGVSLPFKFTGKERDAESGNDNFSARFYSSSLGRFMSPDPENAGATLIAPQSWNAYSYVLNNPLTFIDPDGLDCVYLNEAGTGVESIDRNSTKQECTNPQNGGTWFDGTINSNSVRTDPKSNWVFAEGVGEATTGNSQYSCSGSSCGQDALSSFAGSISGGSSTIVTDTSDTLSTDASAIIGDVYQRARIIADASDVAACTATGMVLGHGNIPPVATHIGIERAAHGLESPKTATKIARAYHTATDARFTAGGKFSKVLVPRTARAIAPVLGTAGKLVNGAGWVILAVEGYESGKECIRQVK